MEGNKTSLKGFTLLELIVGMAIVAVLIGLSVVAIATVQRSQRDTERRAALETMNLELVAYNGDNNAYPASITITGTPRNTVTIAASRVVTLKGNAISVASTATTSTNNATKYCYGVNATNTGYVVGAYLEGSGAYTYFGNTALTCTGL
jgi:prepilin-type N-terminal cleavage/methylation domain-containing protein